MTPSARPRCPVAHPIASAIAPNASPRSSSIRHAAPRSASGHRQVERRADDRERREEHRGERSRRHDHRADLVDEQLPPADRRGEQQVERPVLFLAGDRPRPGADREDQEQDRPQAAEGLAPQVPGRRREVAADACSRIASGRFCRYPARSDGAVARCSGRRPRTSPPRRPGRCPTRSARAAGRGASSRRVRSRRAPSSVVAGASPFGPKYARNRSSRLGSWVSTLTTVWRAASLITGSTAPSIASESSSPCARTSRTPGSPRTPRAARARRSGARSGARTRAFSSPMSATVASRPSRMIPTRSQTRSTSGITCELRNTVRAALTLLVEHRVERLLHERVEPLRGLVQDQQLGPVHERLDEADLLLVPVGEILDPLRRGRGRGASARSWRDREVDRLRGTPRSRRRYRSPVSRSYRASSPGR